MIEILEGFSDKVVAARAAGRVTRHDYEAVLIPQVETTAMRHPKIRCYYEMCTDVAGMEPGAAWEDFRVGVGYLDAMGARRRGGRRAPDDACGERAPLPDAGTGPRMPNRREGNGALLG